MRTMMIKYYIIGKEKKSTEKVESLTRIKIIAMIFSISSYEIFLHHHHLDQFIIDRGSNFIWLTKIRCSLIECMYVFYFQKKNPISSKIWPTTKKKIFFLKSWLRKKVENFLVNWKKISREEIFFFCAESIKPPTTSRSSLEKKNKIKFKNQQQPKNTYDDRFNDFSDYFFLLSRVLISSN